MVGQEIPNRTSPREKKRPDYFGMLEPADRIPSAGVTFQRVNSDSRSAENQAAAAHFEEETAKQEGHPGNPKVKKELKNVLESLF